mmetsp:Transcript_19441/g.23256  ORF Transcript_19441/g.23256 Transcript_19441/m.23256 type:complete len:117 (+) Transcript_19441:110-460(+)|eukprot:CAMPEP_0197853844 /NCGR_PEP_ID=MMETSP1438-20131217/23525_1 /TAXON_ID=1461541 /ORGANISM="Pterosperma sp., Strain CCMP1384" /LENGTH=116 /DNA_ID=CAMNT_0043468387 /DNA_START=110 /DNA_END=460 /DNA_ORIENTATION=+
MSQVRATHILIKHSGSRRPASWKDPEGQEIKKRSKDQAIQELSQLREEIIAGKYVWEDVAQKVSDCGSAKAGGDLSWFGPGDMQKPFEDATFALNIGDISGIVDTDSGVHIIKRTG